MNIQVIKQYQILMSGLVDKNKEQEKEISRLTRLLEADGKKTRQRKSDTTVSDALLPHVNTINTLGKKFAIVAYPWFKSTAFLKLTGRPSITLTGIMRYQTPEMEDLALTAEIYDNVPASLHHFLQGEPKFGELV